MTEKHFLDDLLEPGAVMMAKADPRTALSVIADASTAISLKRIADAFTGPVNEYGETMAEAIPGTLGRAIRDGSFRL